VIQTVKVMVDSLTDEVAAGEFQADILDDEGAVAEVQVEVLVDD